MDQNDVREKSGLKIEMTPMIDVVFLLLIFFIVNLAIPEPEGTIATQQSHPGPGPGPKPPDQIEEFAPINLYLSWDAENKQVQRSVNNLAVPEDSALLAKLHYLAEINEKGRVLLSCDDEVPYQHIVGTVGIIKQSGLQMQFVNL
ncbi:MAG: biopolymer transporter ExbD [Planctomycetes bacterium]|nr:biopolymer transporter ExbD [Planctomycetota bacterium]